MLSQLQVAVDFETAMKYLELILFEKLSVFTLFTNQVVVEDSRSQEGLYFICKL
jgi:hypothetical protein